MKLFDIEYDSNINNGILMNRLHYEFTMGQEYRD
jgi:hypothetical protein